MGTILGKPTHPDIQSNKIARYLAQSNISRHNSTIVAFRLKSLFLKRKCLPGSEARATSSCKLRSGQKRQRFANRIAAMRAMRA